MSEHERDPEVDFAAGPKNQTTQHAPQTDVPTMGNAALSQLLAQRVDREDLRSQGAGPLDEDIGAKISSAIGGGAPLDAATKVDMESHLGVDLSAVRIHTDSTADSLSRSVQAEAFTTGTDVFFSSGAYQAGSTDGRRLLGHELTHVVQQSTGDAGEGGRVSHPDDPHEREAKAVGDAIASSPVASVDRAATEELQESSTFAGVQREEAEEFEEDGAS